MSVVGDCAIGKQLSTVSQESHNSATKWESNLSLEENAVFIS